MMQPKRTKYRKQFKGRNAGLAQRGSSVAFGDFGLKATSRARMTAREIEVLELVSQGHSNREIGKTLHISTATVKTHLIHIFDKLGVDDRTAAVTVALERGILRLGGK